MPIAAILVTPVTSVTHTDFSALVLPLDEMVQRHVESAMILCNGNRALAAKRLGFTRQTLYRYLAKYGIRGVIKHATQS